MRKAVIWASLALALAGCHKADTAAPAAKADPFTITRIGLPGEGRGDYILADPDNNRLFVTHSARVHILALDTLQPIAQVTGLTSAHGVAIDPVSGHGFVTDGVPVNEVDMFDPATGEVLKKIPAGEKPDAILYDPYSRMILAFDGGSSQVSVIDPAKAEVVKTIALPAGPEFPQTNGQGTVWVNLEDANAIAVLDTKDLTFKSLIKLDGCEGPAPLAFDAADHRLFAGCGNKMVKVVNSDTGNIVATMPAGGDPDGMVYDPERKRIIVANRDGAWTIIDQQDADHYTEQADLPIDEYAKTIALDPKTGRLFSSTADLVWPPAVPGKKHLPNAKSGTFRLMVVSQN